MPAITKADLETIDGVLRLATMTYTRRDYTDQEMLVAKILDELGIRYEQQTEFGERFHVDFYLSSENIVIEVDGIMGHFKKADIKRDNELLKLGVERIIHLKGKTKKELREEIEKELL